MKFQNFQDSSVSLPDTIHMSKITLYVRKIKWIGQYLKLNYKSFLLLLIKCCTYYLSRHSISTPPVFDSFCCFNAAGTTSPGTWSALRRFLINSSVLVLHILPSPALDQHPDYLFNFCCSSATRTSFPGTWSAVRRFLINSSVLVLHILPPPALDQHSAIFR